jgi:hypothetical protein
MVALMLRKILAAVGLGLGAAAAGSAGAHPPYAPYSETAINDIYNMLFCDNLSAFLPSAGRAPVPWQLVLSSEPPDIPALVALADDSNQEGRIRYLAYTRLRALGHTVPAKRLFGVIAEIPMPSGMDTLAAYSDGGVRHINYTSKLVIFEQVPSLQPYVQRLFAVAGSAVARLGPWEESRRPPPKAGQVRITFLVSDGLYFGEGPMTTMQRDAIGGPVIQKAGELLQAAVALAIKADKDSKR